MTQASSRISRRDFLLASICGGTALAVGAARSAFANNNSGFAASGLDIRPLTFHGPQTHAGQALARADDPLPIVDTHQHLWDLTKFRLPWVTKGSKMDHNFLPSDYAQATAGQHVLQTVYMEVDVDPSQQQQEADYVIALCKDPHNPMRAAVISGRPGDDGFFAYAKQFKDSPYIKGIRRVLHGEETPSGYCLDPSFVKSIQQLGELGLSFDLCTRAEDLPHAIKLVDACPGTRFILDHCGNEDVQAKDHAPWMRNMDEIAKRDQVVCKVSGIIASAKEGAWTADDLAPIVNHTLDTFGPNRVMFAGDWPVCTMTATFAEWVAALLQIVSNRPRADQAKLFAENAVAYYGLPALDSVKA